MAFEFTTANPREISEEDLGKNISFVETIRISNTSKIQLGTDNNDKKQYIYKTIDIYSSSELTRVSKEYEIGRFLTEMQNKDKETNPFATDHIVKVYDHFIVKHKDLASKTQNKDSYKSTYYIKMEYVPNSFGFDMLIPCVVDKKERYDIMKASPIIMQLLETVNFIHSHGILHNGIMPDNIIFNSETVKISMLDFKYSCILGAKMVKETLIEMYSCKTNEKYMFTAPEILKNTNFFKETTDASALMATDIYSLGSVLYCLFNNGRLPNGLNYEGEEASFDKTKLSKEHIPSDTGEEQFDRVLDGLTDFNPNTRIGLPKAVRMLKQYIPLKNINNM